MHMHAFDRSVSGVVLDGSARYTSMRKIQAEYDRSNEQPGSEQRNWVKAGIVLCYRMCVTTRVAMAFRRRENYNCVISRPWLRTPQLFIQAAQDSMSSSSSFRRGYRRPILRFDPPSLPLSLSFSSSSLTSVPPGPVPGRVVYCGRQSRGGWPRTD